MLVHFLVLSFPEFSFHFPPLCIVGLFHLHNVIVQLFFLSVVIEVLLGLRIVLLLEFIEVAGGRVPPQIAHNFIYNQLISRVSKLSATHEQ